MWVQVLLHLHLCLDAANTLALGGHGKNSSWWDPQSDLPSRASGHHCTPGWKRKVESSTNAVVPGLLLGCLGVACTPVQRGKGEVQSGCLQYASPIGHHMLLPTRLEGEKQSLSRVGSHVGVSIGRSGEEREGLL